MYPKIVKFSLFYFISGMSALAGMFLMYLDEEDAFWCFVSLLERQKYFSGYFDDLMERYSYVYSELSNHSLISICGDRNGVVRKLASMQGLHWC